MPDTRTSAALDRAIHHAFAYLDSLPDAPVAARRGLEELRARIDVGIADEGVEPAQVIDELVEAVDGGLLATSSGRFFAWVLGGTLPAAMASDWLVSTWDQNSCMYATSPAFAVMEEVTGRWLKELFGLPADAGFAFVTGSQMAHATCLVSARHEVLARRGWNVERAGLSGAPPIRILASDQRHGSVYRAVQFVGLGTDSMIPLETDRGGRVLPESLARELEAGGDAPTIVVLQAGDINTGVYDRFTELVPLAHTKGAWVHVDGAIGLWVQAAPSLRHLAEGVASADSWVSDGHKWLNVPYDCGYAFIAHPDAQRAAMAVRASYLDHAKEARDQIDWNPEWSRRGRAAPTYAAIRELGRNGISDLVERGVDLAGQLYRRISALDGAEGLWEPIINQGLVRFLSSEDGASDADHDEVTERVVRWILDDGETFFQPTTWQGLRSMRISVSDWKTDESHVDRAVAAVERAIAGVRGR